jgi:hypothetical protein
MVVVFLDFLLPMLLPNITRHFTNVAPTSRSQGCTAWRPACGVTSSNKVRSEEIGTPWYNVLIVLPILIAKQGR